MKRKCNKIILAAILVFAVGIGVLIAVLTAPARTNKRILANLTVDFSNVISQQSQEKIAEAKSVYGKLNGNGNGIAYFGAVLVKKSAVPDIDALLAELDAEFEIVGVVEQKGQNVQSTYLQHRSLSYDTPVEDGQFITIYFYNSGHPDSNPNDPAGH